MPANEFVTHSAEETIAKGREIAAKLRPPVLVLLKGDLGSGKTTLTKGIISGLGAAKEEDVTSPTFNLVHDSAFTIRRARSRASTRARSTTSISTASKTFMISNPSAWRTPCPKKPS